MGYKYRRFGFGKKLNVPESVLERVYSRTATLFDAVQYKLEDKIPLNRFLESDRELITTLPLAIKQKIVQKEISIVDYIEYNLKGRVTDECLSNNERYLIKKVGYDKIKEYITAVGYDECRKLDWPWLIYQGLDEVFFSLGKAKDTVKKLQERTFTKEEMRYSSHDYHMQRFNKGELEIERLFEDWEIYKGKDLTHYLEKIRSRMKNEDIKYVMDKYGAAVKIIDKRTYNRAVDIVRRLTSCERDETKEREMISDYLEKISYLSNEEVQQVFDYLPLEKSLTLINDKKNPKEIKKICAEIETLPKGYFSEIPFGLDVFKEPEIVRFIAVYGLKNVVDFDNAHSGFLSKPSAKNRYGEQENYEMLKYLSRVFVNNDEGKSENKSKKSLYPSFDGSEKTALESSFSKDEFHEAIRRIFMYHSTETYRDQEGRRKFAGIEGEFKEKNSDLFISEDAPEELKHWFYKGLIRTSTIAGLSKEERMFLKGKNLENCMEGPNLRVVEGKSIKTEFLYSKILSKIGFEDTMDFIAEYADILNNFYGYSMHDEKLSKFETLDELKDIYADIFSVSIMNSSTEYPKNVPQGIKDRKPNMFLPENAPKELQEAFYKRTLTPEQVQSNPKYMEYFENTEIIFGFPLGYSASIVNSIVKGDDIKKRNEDVVKIVGELKKINDKTLENIFLDYLKENINSINLDQLSFAVDVLRKISYSNAKEIYAFRNQIAPKILESDDPLAKLKEIEDVFLKKDMPISGKLFSSFELLSPDINSFNFSEHSRISPTLKGHKSGASKKAIIFSDLLKISLGSNNRSLKEYIDSLELGNNIYESVVSGRIKFEDLKESEVAELLRFRDKILAVTKARFKKKNGEFSKTENVVEDIKKLGEIISPREDQDKNIADRIVHLFCGSVGISSIYQARQILKEKLESVNHKNRSSANAEFEIEVGDLIKGIDKKFFGKILQSGSVSKEFLGDCADSDATPLDTDLSMVTKKSGSIGETINGTAAKSYGNVWFVLKKDDRFVVTRDHEGKEDSKPDKLSKMELFYTGVCDTEKSKHYGIRTGFATSEIDCIIVENYTPEVGLEIALNGFYIPVRDKNGKVVFSPEQYDTLRAKMAGLKEYGCDEFKFSESLYTPEVEDIAAQIEKSQEVTEYKRAIINSAIKEAIAELGLELKTSIDGDLSSGIVELIDTGSTGRGTNKPGDGDFDFMMRVDRNILNSPKIMSAIKAKIMSKLGEKHASEVTAAGDFRLKDVELKDVIVDIDISFVEKSASTTFSTDMALKERLEQIKKQDPRAYKYVIANILFAKQVLKKAEAYKPCKSEVSQGGLGGVGIENWILQHGGSFVDAAKSFLKAAEGKGFAEFKQDYQIWDFGENHFAERKGIYPHDNFVSNNMSEEGYEKMKQALLEYIKDYNKTYGIKTKGGE